MDNRSNRDNFTKYISGIYWNLRSEVKKGLKDFGIGLGHVSFLQLVLENEGINQEDIKKNLSMDKGSVARAISKLVELGYIKKELNMSDKRAYKLYPTLRLKKLFPDIMKLLNLTIEPLISDIDNDTFDETLSGLEKIFNNNR